MAKKQQPLTVKLVAGLTALAALAPAIASNVDPWSCLARGAIGYVVGKSLAGLWCALFNSLNVEKIDEPESELESMEPADESQLAAA